MSSAGESLSDEHLQVVEIELAEIGYVLSSRLRTRLASSSLSELAAFRSWAVAVLLAHLGGDRKHEPLFRKFPEGIPENTATWSSPRRRG